MHGQADKHDRTASQKPSRLIQLLRWRVVIPSVIALLVVPAPVYYRLWHLAQVPDIGDPFPIAELLKPIPPEHNAYPLFEKAIALRKAVSPADADEYRDEYDDDGWKPTDKILNKYLKLNRPALDKWREATEKEDSQFVPLARFADVAYVVDVQAGRDFHRWCKLEIERLTKSDRPGQALPWLKASFRSSSLVTRNASMLDRLVGTAYFAMSVDSAEPWMRHPRVSANQLRELLANVQQSERLLEDFSTNIKIDNLISRFGYDKWTFEEMQTTYGAIGIQAPLTSKWQA